MGVKKVTASGFNFIFFISNLLFAIAALILVAFGAVLVTDYTHYLNFLQRGGTWSLVGSIGYLMIAIGVFVTLVYLIGTFGACKKSKNLLYFFAVVLTLIIVMETALAITLFVYSGALPRVMGGIMRDNIRDYKNASDHSSLKNEWDEIQTNFKCCGVKNYTDWGDTFTNGNQTVSFRSLFGQLAPFSCCNSTTKCYRPDEVTKDSVYPHGCLTKFERTVETKLGLVGQTTMTIVTIQLLSIGMAVYFGKNNALNRKKAEMQQQERM